MKVQELIKDTERGKGDKEKQMIKYREKARTYKSKLRLALQNVQTLAQRIARYELQIGPEREENRLGGTPVVISNGVISASGHNNLGGNSVEDIDRLMRRMQDEDELRDEIQNLLNERR